jgi:hypothetical protein
MVTFIEDIITRFGGRYFGSEQERKAQEYTASVFSKYCDTTKTEPFESALESHFQSLKIFCILYAVSLGLYTISLPAAAILATINTILFLGHFVTYRHWLDFLFRKRTSWNTIGDIEPVEEATSTIIVSGHMDSVKEFKWWYKLKHTGAILSVIAGLLFPLISIFLIITVFTGRTFTTDIILGIFVLATPILIVYYDMHGETVVDGALDNLTGVAVALEMAKYFSVNKLKNTRLRVISFGAEEAGLRGSWAYAKAHKEQLLREHALLVNLDTIKEKAHLTVVESELNTLVFYDKENVGLIENSFKATGTGYKKLPITVGATDASAFHILGLPAIAVIGMQSEKLDPSYHTRMDNLNYLDHTGLDAMRDVLIHFIKEWDK